MLLFAHLLLLLVQLLLVLESPDLFVHEGLLLGQLLRINIILLALLALIVLPTLSLLHSLEAHPLFIAGRMSFICQLLFALLSILQVSKVGHMLSLFDFPLHEPVIHGLAAALVLGALLPGDLQELLFYFVLRLAYQFAL